MLTSQELNQLAELLEKAAPMVRRLAALDVAGAEANVARLNAEGPNLIAHYKEISKRECREEMSGEIQAHNTKLKAERDAHDAHCAQERSLLQKDRAEAASIKNDGTAA